MARFTKTEKSQIAAARASSAKYEVALSVLAMGDASTQVTDEFQEKLADAKIRMGKYRTRSPRELEQL